MPEQPAAAPSADDERTQVQIDPPPAPPAAGAAAFPFLAPPQAADELGRLGGYRVLKKLGEGANGIVFRAEDAALRRFVALKVMRPEFAEHPQAADYFLREGRSLAGLKSDHVVTIHQVAVADGVPFLVMEFLEGAPLDAWMKAQAGPVPLAQALHVVRDTLRGLAAAHEQGLIHRDIKPANLWVEAGTSRIKILDFGLTRAASGPRDLRLTADGAVVGTPAYMAPEQAGGKAVDVRADLFSVGTVFYHLLAGKNPFLRGEVLDTLKAVCFEAPPPIAAVRPDVPPAYAAFLDRLLAKKPAGRPADARAALAELTAVEQQLEDQARTAPAMALTAVPVPAADPGPPSVWNDLTHRISGLRGARPPLSRAAAAGLIGGGLVAAALIVGGLIFLAANLRDRPKDDGPRPEAKKDDPKPADPVKPPAKPPEPAPGPDWIALTDDAKPNPFERWAAEGDRVAATAPGAVGWLRSPEQYADFELELECQVRPKADSGIFLRAWPGGAPTGEEFVEVQIVDDDRARGAASMGAIRDRAAPTVRAPYRPGEWAAFHVRVVGNRVAVTVNGTTCTDAEVAFPRPAGHVGLQVKGARLAFRRVRVRPLANPDRAAAEFALRRGGSVVVNGAVIADAKALPAEAFKVTQVNLGGPREPLDDADLARFRDLTALRGLELGGPITDAGLATLAKLPAAAALEHLSLYGAAVTDDGLAAALAAFPGVRRLAVVGCPRLTGAFLKGVAGKPVESLYLGDLALQDGHLRHLRAAPRLTDLLLLNVGLTDAGLKEVGGVTTLRVLNLAVNPKLTDAGAEHLAGLAELHTLYFQSVPFRAAAFAAFAKLPKLVVLGAHRVGDRGDADVAPLAASPTVERVSLRGTAVTDKTLEAFATGKSLKWLEVNETKVTADGVAKFRAARPDVDLKSDFDPK